MFYSGQQRHSNVHSHVPLHKKCSAKIKHLKSTFSCPSASVLHQDDDGNIAVHLPQDIIDNANTNLSQPLRGGDNVASIAEEEGVYDLYGFWKARPRDPLRRWGPESPVLSGQKGLEPRPPGRAVLDGGGGVRPEVELHPEPSQVGLGLDNTIDTVR